MSSPWESKRGRLRDVIPGLKLGSWPTGPLNSITDVAGVLVHTESIQPDRDVNSGVTTILPRPDWQDFNSFAGTCSFNGCGEMTGAHWINESGLLTSPIILTGSCGVGDAYRGVLDYVAQNHLDENEDVELMLLPVVAETYDGFLSSQSRFPVTPAHVVRGIKEASSDRVPEGNTGGGTGMICHRFKGGTGSSSRVITGFDIDGKPKSYTIGVLVQANYGSTKNLHIGGVPVGGLLLDEQAAAVESSGKEARKDGSIIVVIATDVPLIPVQLQRVAKRAAIGLAKVGGYGSNSSGDIFLAFSTGNKVPGEKFAFGKGSPYQPAPQDARVIDTGTIDGVFEAAADATEEAIYNALFMAETVTGFQGRTVEALNLAKVKEMVERRL